MAVVQEFTYRAIDQSSGTTVKGTLEAPTEASVVTKLKAQGLTPLDVTLLSKTGLRRDLNMPSLSGTVGAKSLAVFARQMAALINAGLPLMRTLTILTEQTRDKRLQQALVTVAADVEGGSSFSAALALHPKVFPPLMVSIVRVGETGGFLGPALTSIAENYQKEAELHNKVRSAVTYPIIVLSIAIIGVLVMVTWVVPVFEKMFKGLGSSLPLPTQILVTISHNMFWILPLLIVASLLLWIWYMRNRHTDAFRKRWDPIKLRLPVFGQLTTKMAVARFTRNLAMMLSAGVPIIQALSIVGQASNNWKIEEAVRDIQDSIRAGKSFSGPLANAAVFPAMVPQMVAVGEESGTLSEMLASIADFYEDEVETATEQLSSAIEPILIVLLGVVIGSMVISLYLPIFTLYGDLAKQH
ncbi:type II secretion system F family protein [Microbacterium rhizosphaerae]|uniref:Type II secretion system F family protein n=1 Tax=Microbacterium rhizosphaerae TaxID=1678237 RepID=A0ABZ0SRT4_9MICO|nr:type II secretion system F family protein [Microbacterium rhizosphaerae]WPR91155.1 type II secretion system F family protein [Microbacterium rhizosphaerae]